MIWTFIKSAHILLWQWSFTVALCWDNSKHVMVFHPCMDGGKLCSDQWDICCVWYMCVIYVDATFSPAVFLTVFNSLTRGLQPVENLVYDLGTTVLFITWCDCSVEINAGCRKMWLHKSSCQIVYTCGFQPGVLDPRGLPRGVVNHYCSK